MKIVNKFYIYKGVCITKLLFGQSWRRSRDITFVATKRFESGHLRGSVPAVVVEATGETPENVSQIIEKSS